MCGWPRTLLHLDPRQYGSKLIFYMNEKPTWTHRPSPHPPQSPSSSLKSHIAMSEFPKALLVTNVKSVVLIKPTSKPWWSQIQEIQNTKSHRNIVINSINYLTHTPIWLASTSNIQHLRWTPMIVLELKTTRNI